MYNDTITELDLRESVRAVVADMVQYRDSTNFDDYLDDISEQADGLVNVYYTGAIHEWTVAGYPDAEELGGMYPEHGTDDSTLNRIAREAQVAMYHWYHAEIVSELDRVLAEIRNNEKENN